MSFGNWLRLGLAVVFAVHLIFLYFTDKEFEKKTREASGDSEKDKLKREWEKESAFTSDGIWGMPLMIFLSYLFFD